MKKIYWILVGILVVSGIGALVRSHSLSANEISEDVCCGSLMKSAVIEWDFQKQPEPLPQVGAVRVPIFIYHSVRPHILNEAKAQDTYDVTPELFERELKYLKDNGYSVISLDALAGFLESGVKPPEKSVILTLDDGWRNQYKYAFPLLKKYGFTATFFVYTNAIGIKHFLTWNDILDMDKNGMTIGSHSVSHPSFIGMPLADIKTEVTESKKILEEKLGKPILNFASPFGYSNPDIVALVKEAGYKTARTTYKGVYHMKPYLLSLRGVLTNDSFDDFVSVASGKTF